MSASPVLPAIQPVLLGCTILLIATPDNQAAIAAGLSQSGFHNLLFASDADTALNFARSEKPDLVLLDLAGDGFDRALLTQLWLQTKDQVAVPILAMIDTQAPDEQARILAAGAADVLVKPVHESKLLARIVIQLERRRLARDLRDFQQRTVTELATAREMQHALLPDEATLHEIKERYDIGIAATFKPSAELGGDLWGAWPIDATRIGVFVCDVSGHGTISAINTFRLHTIMARNDFDRADPGRFLTSLNNRLTGLLVSGQFVTMLYAVIDTRQDRLTYAAAGSPDPLLALAGCPPESLDGSGLPLGIVAGVSYVTQHVPFGHGARLILQSDALAEARLPDGTPLGDQQALAMTVAALCQETPEAIVATLTQNLTDRAGDQLEDDLTLVCIERPRQFRHDGTSAPSTPAQAISGRMLSVGRDPAHRLVVQQGAASLDLAVDTAPDFTCASRFLAEYRYDIVVVDVTSGPEEWLELFHTIVAANCGTRMLLIGMQSELARLLASSLGLTIAAILQRPADVGAMRQALAEALANDPTAMGEHPGRSMTEADLSHALAVGEITFGYQPQVSLTTGHWVGAEALARWTSPNYGAVPSNVFMALVSQGSAAALLADVTLRAAFTACASWRRLASGMRVAVNFSAASLAEPDLPSLVLGRLREADLSPDALTVEVAESDALRSTAALAALRQLGVGISLDGFGQGETSLQSMGQLPISGVKIGRTIIQGCVDDPACGRLLHAITGASRAFNLAIAAVGVEVHAVEQLLREAGCDIAQGWLYGPAMPADGIQHLLAPRQNNPIADRPSHPAAG